VLFLAQYRKSFPSVSASFPSPYCDNSADDSNTSSPQSLRHATGADRQPCYQFRKSNSMKLALKEDVEGDGLRQFINVVPVLIRCRRLMMLCYVYFSDNFRLQFSALSHDLRSDSVFISYVALSFAVVFVSIFQWHSFECCVTSVNSQAYL